MAHFEDIEERDEEDEEYEKCIIETPGEFSHASFTMIPNDIHRNITWARWRSRPRASTAWLLIGCIIRKEMKNKLADAIYKEYFLKRKLLVARYTQQGLAELFGYADRRAISNQLVKCEKEGIFKIEMMPWRNKKKRIYIFGSWENTTGIHHVETIDMFTKFRKEEAERKLKKFVV